MKVKSLTYALAAAAAFGAAPGIASAQDKATIGLSIALSGFVAPYDDGPRKAAHLAIADINAKGGLLGHELVFVEADTKSDPGQGAAAATNVLSQGAQVLMVTCDFDFGAPSALVAQAQNVLAFSSCAADPKFGAQGIGNNAFTMSTATPSQAASLAEWAKNEMGWNSAFLLKDTQVEYTKSLCDNFETRWKELAGDDGIAGMETYSAASDATITSQISQLKALPTQPDFVLFCGAINGGSYVRQLRAAGVETPLVAGESMDGAYWLEAIPNLDDFYVGVYGSVFGNDPDPAVNDFVARFSEMHGAAPVTGHALTGYSVIEAWALAVERAGSFETDAVRAALESFTAEDLLVGSTTFTPDLHINVGRPMLIMKVDDGKHVALERVTPETVPEIRF